MCVYARLDIYVHVRVNACDHPCCLQCMELVVIHIVCNVLRAIEIDLLAARNDMFERRSDVYVCVCVADATQVYSTGKYVYNPPP